VCRFGLEDNEGTQTCSPRTPPLYALVFYVLALLAVAPIAAQRRRSSRMEPAVLRTDIATWLKQCRKPDLPQLSWAIAQAACQQLGQRPAPR
jgi:hypothetical protein